jgi:hypothetical protein
MKPIRIFTAALVATLALAAGIGNASAQQKTYVYRIPMTGLTGNGNPEGTPVGDACPDAGSAVLVPAGFSSTAPASVTIPAGCRTLTFRLTGTSSTPSWDVDSDCNIVDVSGPVSGRTVGGTNTIPSGATVTIATPDGYQWIYWSGTTTACPQVTVQEAYRSQGAELPVGADVVATAAGAQDGLVDTDIQYLTSWTTPSATATFYEPGGAQIDAAVASTATLSWR